MSVVDSNTFPIILELDCGLSMLWHATTTTTGATLLEDISCRLTNIFPHSHAIVFTMLHTTTGVSLPLSARLSSMVAPGTRLRPTRAAARADHDGALRPLLLAVPRNMWMACVQGQRGAPTSVHSYGMVNGSGRVGRGGAACCYPHCIPLASAPNSEICMVCGQYKPTSLDSSMAPDDLCTPRCSAVTPTGVVRKQRLGESFCTECLARRKNGIWMVGPAFTAPSAHQCESCLRPWLRVKMVGDQWLCTLCAKEKLAN